MQHLKESDSNFNDVLVVYDAAFAYQKEALDTWIMESGLRIQILDWYSFEHYILTQEPFLEVLTQEGIGKKWESLERATDFTLKDKIPYAKGHLSQCLRKHSSCNSCKRVDICKFKHHEFKPDLHINDSVRRLEVF